MSFGKGEQKAILQPDNRCIETRNIQQPGHGHKYDRRHRHDFGMISTDAIGFLALLDIFLRHLGELPRQGSHVQ